MKPVRSAVKQLEEAKWLDLAQALGLPPSSWLRAPHSGALWADGGRRRLRLRRAKLLGEAIMREILSLIAAPGTFVDDGSLGLLVNPSTGEQMQLDRYYMHERVGFEFNGYEHYRAIEQPSSMTNRR